MPELVEVASGLSFPEGPIAMPDGSVILVEMFGPRLTRVHPDGSKDTIAEIPGGPNGAAVGPGGTIFLCNNGGRFTPIDLGRHGHSRARDDEQLHRRADPDASTSRAGRSPTSTPSATAIRYAPRTTSSSTSMAASTSPTTVSATSRSASPT